ncbi:MAG TPA: type II toxin-antitoxin system PemK/MazF family toxin [Methanosarcinales archaeon]|nr:type II toxin-antitoxin system PemK/MazF family toxin [Methanosarcinales archaeon]
MKRTPIMTIYEQGDIVLVSFPFTDLTAVKKRPALVVSANWYNKRYRDVVLVAVTSRVPPILDELDYRITESDFKTGKLYKDSVVKLGKVFTIENSLIRRKICGLRSQTMEEILDRLDGVYRE